MDVHFQRDHALNEILYHIKWTIRNSIMLPRDIFKKKSVIR